MSALYKQVYGVFFVQLNVFSWSCFWWRNFSFKQHWSNQLHLSKLNRVLFLESSDSSLDHLNFPFHFCTKIFDERAEVLEHLDTCDVT